MRFAFPYTNWLHRILIVLSDDPEVLFCSKPTVRESKKLYTEEYAARVSR